MCTVTINFVRWTEAAIATVLSESIIDDGDGFIIVAFVFFIVRKQQPSLTPTN
jgi:hypothetical protein